MSNYSKYKDRAPQDTIFEIQRILNEAQFLKSMMSNPLATKIGIEKALAQPTETFKYALCIIAAGPMLVIFPFFQKYFASGLTIGAVKG